ncbi:MAG: bifunctional folylpolyglutamate synthase/dihydrofolate synthase [Ignavibacteriales bacterium]|nr:bifunctional folylpolyglutamate synthase/dihydrofolate synthase [Ignavibacteriales bacterium]
MDLQSALNKIYSMHQFDIKLGLERIESFLDYLGNPHKGLKYFHVAGSNGKGSTASFIASILMEAGYKVGLYTSPHLVKFNERIRINGKEIEDDFIAQFINSNNDFIDKHQPTFFEITTALAFQYFQTHKPDYVVLETGLGGRLDATNVVIPLVSVITSISYEHTNILGDSIKKIAGEKAGIIKSGVPVITGKMPDEALDVIKLKSDETKSVFHSFSEFVNEHDSHVEVLLKGKKYNLYSSGLRGKHQLRNAAAAVKTVTEAIGLDDSFVFNRGLKNVAANTGIQCRYEIYNESPGVIFDSAHNPEGVEAFIREFSKEYKNYDDCSLIFGAMKDKDIEAMLGLLARCFKKVYVTQISYERSASVDELIKIAEKSGLTAISLASPELMIEEFVQKGNNECLVVLGSIYLLGEIKLKLGKKNLDKLK